MSNNFLGWELTLVPLQVTFGHPLSYTPFQAGQRISRCCLRNFRYRIVSTSLEQLVCTLNKQSRKYGIKANASNLAINTLILSDFKDKSSNQRSPLWQGLARNSLWLQSPIQDTFVGTKPPNYLKFCAFSCAF